MRRRELVSSIMDVALAASCASAVILAWVALVAVMVTATSGCSADFKPDRFGISIRSPKIGEIDQGQWDQAAFSAGLSWNLHETPNRSRLPVHKPADE